MDKITQVIKREFMTRVRSKGYIISTLLVPFLLLFVAVLLPVIMTKFSQTETKQIILLDESGQLGNDLAVRLENKVRLGRKVFEVVQVTIQGSRIMDSHGNLFAEVNPENADEDAFSVLKDFTKDKRVFGFMHIAKTAIEDESAVLYTNYVSDMEERRYINYQLSETFRKWKMEQKGWRPEDLSEIKRSVNLSVKKAAVSIKPGEPEVEEKGQSFWLTYVLVLLIYMSILMYGSAIQRSVIEEKESRVVEIIVSSLKPHEFLTGKLFGVGALGLVQMVLWGSVGLFFRLYGGGISSSMQMDENTADILKYIQIPPVVIVFLVVYFILGFFMYSSLYAALGSMVNSEEEAQGTSAPLTILVVLSFMSMFSAVNNPEGTVAVILSHFPLFSPVVMFARITLSMPPWYELAINIVVMAGTIFGILWLVGKIYRVGILMYGKKPSFKELCKWVKYS